MNKARMKKTKDLYKQIIEHHNEKPSDFPYSLTKVSDISETRIYKDLPPASTTDELMKRKPKYTFYVHLKNTSIEALPVHQFTYDKQADANKAYRHYMAKWIDEMIEPYRQKVAKGRKLTLEEMDECERIQNMLKD